jgi:hypothetical protein
MAVAWLLLPNSARAVVVPAPLLMAFAEFPVPPDVSALAWPDERLMAVAEPSRGGQGCGSGVTRIHDRTDGNGGSDRCRRFAGQSGRLV